MDQTMKAHHPQRDIHAIVSALVALMVATVPLAQMPTWKLASSFLGSELALEFGADLLGAMLIVGLVGAAALCAPLSRETRGLRAVLALAAHWTRPMLWALAMWEVAPNLKASLGRAAFAAAGSIALAWLMRLSEPDTESVAHQEISLFGDLATFVALLALLTMIHAAHLRSALSATSAAVLSTLAALGLLHLYGKSPRQMIAAPLTVGMLMGQLTWALNYCAVAPPTAGGVLLLAFYTMVGILRHALRDRLKARHILEYAFVCAAGLVILAARTYLWRG